MEQELKTKTKDCLLEAFPQLTHTIFSKIRKEIIKYSSACRYESCGIVCGAEVFLLQNIAEDKMNFFSVDPVEYLPFLEEDKISFLWHSHVNCEATPSILDVQTAKEFMCDNIIYSTLSKNFCFFSYDLSKVVYF